MMSIVRAGQRARSIALQLYLTVNLTLGVALAGLLAVQYDREMKQAVSEKRTSLGDEAIAIHAAAVHLSDEHGQAAVQSYIDSVCTQMRESWSPRHHIAVSLPASVLTDRNLDQGTRQLLTEFDSAADDGRQSGFQADPRNHSLDAEP